MESNLTIGSVISNGFKLGLKNFFPLLVNFILWVLTIWIPYLNIGTTIGLSTLPLAMSKGKSISIGEIFDGKYRKIMGEFFLLQGLRGIVIFTGYLFFIIPGIIMALSYILSNLLLIDKEMNPMEAMNQSNKLTYGHKWTIFLGIFILMLPMLIPFLNFIYIFLYIPILMGALAHIYGTLTGQQTTSSHSDGVLDSGQAKA